MPGNAGGDVVDAEVEAFVQSNHRSVVVGLGVGCASPRPPVVTTVVLAAQFTQGLLLSPTVDMIALIFGAVLVDSLGIACSLVKGRTSESHGIQSIDVRLTDLTACGGTAGPWLVVDGTSTVFRTTLRGTTGVRCARSRRAILMPGVATAAPANTSSSDMNISNSLWKVRNQMVVVVQSLHGVCTESSPSVSTRCLWNEPAGKDATQRRLMTESLIPSSWRRW